MKILQIPTYAVYGGMSLHVLALSRGLREKGHEVEVLSMCEGPLMPEFRVAGIPIDAVPFLGTKTRKDPFTVFRAIRYLCDEIRRRKPDVVHTHGPRAHFMAGLASRLAGHPVLVASIHGSFRQFSAGNEKEMDPWRSRLKEVQYGGIDELAARLADQAVAVCRATRREMLESLKVPARKVTVIHNGIDEQQVAKAEADAIRRELGFSEGPHKVVLYVGRLAFHKGSRDLIDAAELVAARLPDARFVFVGDGPLEAEMRSRAATGPLAGKTVFTGSRDDAVAFMPTADLLVLPSLSEGLPLTLLEAAMMGRAMVVTDVGGMSEVVVPGETGELVSPRNPVALSAAIIELLDDDALRRSMGAAARKLWEEEYRAPIMFDRFESLYRDLIATRKR